MKKKLTLICAAMLTCGVNALHAQQPGDDYTSAITNAGFEDAFSYCQNRNGEGTTDSGQGWIYDWNIPDNPWSNFQSIEEGSGGETSKEGSRFLDNWAGNVNSMDVHQTITGLPAGYYQLSACLRITTSADDITDQHVYAELNSTTYDSPVMSEVANGKAIENWEKLTTALIPVSGESDEIRIGIRSTGKGSGAAGWFQADDFQLIYAGDANDPEVEKGLALADLEKVNDEVQEYAQSEDMMKLGGLQEDLNYAVEEAYMAIMVNDDATVEEIKAAIASIKGFLATAKAGVILYNKFAILHGDCSTLLATTAYAGQDAFIEAISAAQELIDNPETLKQADIEKAIADLKTARTAYNWSQIPSADQPADYTFLIQGPSFYNPECGLAYDQFTDGNHTTWQDIEKWTNGSIGSGDYRANHYGGKPCWNSWSTNYTSMDIHQDLAGLPNGYYSIKCVASTQDGCLNDQHAYVKSAGIATSAPMTIDNAFGTPEGWEELATEKVAVVDGKLTIGFASTKDATKTTGSAADGRNGWFCVTDFTLLYYGAISETDYKAILDETVAKAEAMEIVLKGDYKAMTGALAIAANATTTEQIIAALDTITASMEIINASNTAYKKFEQGALATAKTNAGTLTGNGKEIMDNIIARTEAYVASDEATQEDLLATYEAPLSNYKTYADALPNIEAIVNEPPTGYFENTLTELQSIMADQKATLANELASKGTIDWFITYLNKAASAVKASVFVQDAKNKTSYDMTGIIMNADAAAKDGWVWLNLTDGPVKSGQYYAPEEVIIDEEAQDTTETNTHSYFDSWNSTSGKLKLTAYQELDYLPNGNYTLKVAARSSCENGGALLFVTAKGNEGIAANDTIWQSIACNWDEGGNILETAKANDPTSFTALAKKGKGYGWNLYEFTFDVKDHKASIGMSTDSLITHKPFTGTWFSVVDFQLTMNTWAADNDDNFGWVTGMDIPITDDLVPMVIKTDNKVISVTNAATGEAVKNYKVFTVTGTEVNPVVQQNTGIYVVKAGTQVEKVLVK